MASRTSSRSIIFSRATASATSSKLGAGNGGIHGGWSLDWGFCLWRSRRSARRSAPGAPCGYPASGSATLAAVIEAHARGRPRPRTEHDARKNVLRPLTGMASSALGQMAGKAVPVLGPGQRPVDARRADLQVPIAPGMGSSTSSTAPTAWLIASQSSTAISAAIGAVGHDLHRRRLACPSTATRTSSKPIDAQRGG